MGGFAKKLFGRMRGAEIYQRPHDFSFVIQTFVPANQNRTCCIPGGMRLPVKSFLVQSDLANGGVINIGSSQVSLIMGLQLDAGRAIQFSVGADSIQTSLFDSPMDWQDAIAQSQLQHGGPAAPASVYINLADYFVASDSDNQRIRIFWTTLSR